MHYVGKKGFHSVAEKRHVGKALKALNLWQLSDMVEKLVDAKTAQMENQKVVVDLSQMGYRKLLGLGSISRAVQVKVDHCSEGALKKIKEAGGDAVLSKPAK
jgi:large subunit ribosomal protein L15